MGVDQLREENRITYVHCVASRSANRDADNPTIADGHASVLNRRLMDWQNPLRADLQARLGHGLAFKPNLGFASLPDLIGSSNVA
jgi:hypothetical protein